MRSLRGQFLAWLTGALTAAGLLAGTAAYLLDRAEVAETLDAQLRQVAIYFGRDGVPATLSAGLAAAVDVEDELVIVAWDPRGKSRSSDYELDLPRPIATGFFEATAAGEDWRVFAEVGLEETVGVAQRMALRRQLTNSSALRAVLPILLLIPVTWFLVGWVVRRVLAPLSAMTAELTGWTGASGQSLSLTGLPEEVLPLATATNDLVTRLQAQIDFRQTFISDAAHELRTPLTALSLQEQNLRAVTTPAQAAMVSEIERGIRRMTGTVGQLLSLARAESFDRLGRAGPVDLRAVVVASVQAILPLATRRSIDVGMIEGPATGAGTVVDATPADVQSIVDNLLDNAVRYTSAGGGVDLEIRGSNASVILEVRDTGPGIPPAMLERVFDRFFRVSSQEGGSGLGLAIVKATAERNAASVTIDPAWSRAWFSKAPEPSSSPNRSPDSVLL